MIAAPNKRLQWTPVNEGTMRVLSNDGERTETHPNAKNIHQPLIEDFAAAVLANREPLVTGEIGLKVALLEERIYREGLGAVARRL